MKKKIGYLKLTFIFIILVMVAWVVSIEKPEPHLNKKPQYVFRSETISENEPAMINAVKENILTKFKNNNPPGVSPVRRDAHAKSIGCVKAVFAVHNEKLPPELRVGIFARNQTFPAWIRFSNGNPTIKADKNLDTRGMAIKLMNIPGAKILDDEKN